MNNQPITIHLPYRDPADRRTLQRSEHSTSASDDEEDSAGRGVDIYSQDYSDDQEESYVAEDRTVNPSESASRLSSAPDSHHQIEKRRRPSKIEQAHHQRRSQPLTRARRQPYHSPPESEVGSHEDLAYDGSGGYPAPGRQRPGSFYGAQQGHPSHPYGQSYAHHNGGYGQYPTQAPQPPGQQLTRMQNGFGGPQNPYGAGPVQSPYYQGHYAGHHPGYQGAHPGAHPGMPPQMQHHPGSGYGTPDMMHPQSPQYIQSGMSPQGYFPQPFTPHPLQSFMQAPHPVIQYVPVPAASPPPTLSQPQAPSSSNTPAPAPEAAVATPAPARTPAPAPAPAPEPLKNDGYEELKAMLIKEREEREAREAAAKKAEEDRIAKAEADRKRAEEIAAAEQRAAAAAKSEAEKKAAEEREAAAIKAAEEAAKIKEEAEAAMKKAAEEAAKNAAKAKEEADAAAAKAKEEHEAALAAAVAPPPPDKPKPIRFKDAVGRKFNFPFHLCQTWEGMEDLIKQAFLHVDVIGQHVADGHYDLIGPNNEIILPAVWETVIEPDWAITMHMWPLPEPEAEPSNEVDPEIAVLDPMPAAGDTGKQDGKDQNKKGKGKALSKPKGKLAGFPPLPVGVEILDGPQPPAPPPVPSGSIADGPTGTNPKKKNKPATWGGLFGPPRPKPKVNKPPPPAPKKPA